ncbi:MAG: TVP38/TMEM64 family protein [Hyphomicrobiaceae bacterium]
MDRNMQETPPVTRHEVVPPDEREAPGVGASHERWLAITLLFTLLLGVAIGLGVYVDRAGISFHDATIRATEYIRSWGAMATAASIGLMILHGVVPVPAEILAVANFMVFGPYWGFVITWLGAMVAACLAFGLSRYLGRPFLRRILCARRYAQADRWVVQQSVPALLLCRLIPLVSFNAVNFGAGLMSISWWTFIWTTAVGIVPATFVVLLVTESVLAGNAAMAVLASVAACALTIFWVWRRQHRAASR